MLTAALLLLDVAAPTVSAASVALRANARAALPTSAFPAGLAVVDEHGNIAGKVMSVDQGLVTVKTQHSTLRLPTSAFAMRGGPVIMAISAAQVEILARMGLPAK